MSHNDVYTLLKLLKILDSETFGHQGQTRKSAFIYIIITTTL